MTIKYLNIIFASFQSEALEKFKKRAERFGTVVSDNLKKVEEQEKLLKRKERFGEVTSATLKRSISNVPSEIDVCNPKNS